MTPAIAAALALLLDAGVCTQDAFRQPDGGHAMVVVCEYGVPAHPDPPPVLPPHSGPKVHT